MSSTGGGSPPADGGCPTTASGVVYDPAGKNPLYGVSVYVPSGSVGALADGTSCAACTALYSAPATTGAVTDATGAFTLTNVPPGSNVPVIVQAGKWRKLYHLPQVTACQPNAFATKFTLPSKHDSSDPTVGDIPNIAIKTGGLDTLECLLLRMGVDPTEYTADPLGAGRIKIFTGYNGATFGGADGGVAIPSQRLWDSASDLARYDLVLLACDGREPVDGPTQGATSLTDTDRQALLDYVNGGGRVFASHYNYGWFNTGPFNAVTPPMATWLTGSNSIDDSREFYAVVTTTVGDGGAFPEGTAMQQWLGNVGAFPDGGLPIFQTRHNVTRVNDPPGQTWLSLDPSAPVPGAVQYFSVDSPIGASTPTCGGRVVYSDLHASGGAGMGIDGQPPDYPNTTDTVVPGQCAMHDLTPQEKALEFMIFNLSACTVSPGSTQPPPSP